MKKNYLNIIKIFMAYSCIVVSIVGVFYYRRKINQNIIKFMAEKMCSISIKLFYPLYTEKTSKLEWFAYFDGIYDYWLKNQNEYKIDQPDDPSYRTDFFENWNVARLPSVPETSKDHVAPSAPGKLYAAEQLKDYDFLMSHFYIVHASTTADRKLMDAEAFLNENFAVNKDKKPQILIYHTHSQETYSDFDKNPQATVVGIGDYLTKLLEEKGYTVFHDRSVYDLRNGKLDRNKAYNYALDGITKILNENPSIQVILDVHRDGVDENRHLLCTINGKATAPIMFFGGLSRTPEGPVDYLPNPYTKDNLAFTFQLQLKAAAYYPDFTRKIYLKGLRYNMHLRPASALIEVGAQTNSFEEANNAMEPLAELLDMVLQGK